MKRAPPRTRSGQRCRYRQTRQLGLRLCRKINRPIPAYKRTGGKTQWERAIIGTVLDACLPSHAIRFSAVIAVTSLCDEQPLRLPRVRFGRESQQEVPNPYNWDMNFPIKKCVVCGEEFELKPGKPGFANRCPSCSEDESADSDSTSGDQWKSDKGANAARRDAMRNLLYRKDS